MRLRLVREVLDEQVVDGNQQPLGKVDGVTLEIRPRGRPRVAAIQVGAPVLALRLRQPMRALVGWFARRWHAQTMTLPWSQVQKVAIDIEVRLEGHAPESRVWEQWLTEHVVDKIPGS